MRLFGKLRPVSTPRHPGAPIEVQFYTELKRKEVIYHFLMWQMPGAAPFPDEIVFFPGDSDWSGK